MSERLSAWMDGELEGKQAEALLTELKRDSILRGAWARYHLIGDTLRGIQGPDLSVRISGRLDSEPAVLANWLRISIEGLGNISSIAGAKAAAVGVVSIVGLMSFQYLQQDAPEAPFVPQPQFKRVVQRTDEGAKDYLLAHQPYSAGNGLQGLAVYVRAMSLQDPSPRRPGDKWKCDF